jgi:hypothetical protein
MVVAVGVVKVAVVQISVPTQASASPHPAATIRCGEINVGFMSRDDIRMVTYCLGQGE